MGNVGHERRALGVYCCNRYGSKDKVEVIVSQQYSSMIDRTEFPAPRMDSIVSVQYQLAIASFYAEYLCDYHRKDLRKEENIHVFLKKLKEKM